MDQDEDEDVTLPTSELGRYEARLEVQCAFRDYVLQTTLAFSRQGVYTPVTPVPVSTNQVRSRTLAEWAWMKIYDLNMPARLEQVTKEYEKFLHEFPTAALTAKFNSKIQENLQNIQKLAELPRLRNGKTGFNWFDVFPEQQLFGFTPFVIATKVGLYSAMKMSSEPIEIQVLKTTLAVGLELRQCWTQLFDTFNANVYYKSVDISGVICSMQNAMQTALVATYIHLDDEMEAMPRSLYSMECFDSNTFTTSTSYMDDCLSTMGRSIFLKISEILSVTEAVLGQLVEYSFRLSILYCMSQYDDSFAYYPFDLQKFLLDTLNFLKTEFGNFWKDWLKAQEEADAKVKETRARILDSLTPSSKLIQATNLIKDKLESTLLVLDNIERVSASSESMEIKKSELIQLKTSLEEEVSAIQNMSMIETKLIDSLVNEARTSNFTHVSTQENTSRDTKAPNINEQSTETVPDSRTTFEAEDLENQDRNKLVDTTQVKRQDEVFELITLETDPEVLETIVSKEYSVGPETIIAQKLLLDQLNSRLKPRREEMKKREREAYYRKYGKYPEEEADEILMLISEATKDGCESDQFGDCADDEVVEEETSNPFETRLSFAQGLDQMISDGGLRIIHGIVPIQKPDQDTTSEDNTWAPPREVQELYVPPGLRQFERFNGH